MLPPVSITCFVFSGPILSLNPWILGSSLSHTASSSAARANERGDNGQPCRVPLCRGKEEDSHPLTATLEQGRSTAGEPTVQN